MNRSLLNWNMDAHLPHSDNTQKRSMGEDNELMELLWRNGQVVQQSQTHRKPGSGGELNQRKKTDADSFMNLSSLIDEDESASWIQYPLDDSLAGDFCSTFFYELSNNNNTHPPIEKDKAAIKHFGAVEDTQVRITNNASRPVFRQPNDTTFPDNSSHITTTQDLNLGGLERIENFPHFSRTIKAEIPTTNVTIRRGGVDNGASSVMTIGSSHCGSNQVLNEGDRSRVSSNGLGAPIKESTSKAFPLSETIETTITSSSGGSGGSYNGTEKQSTQPQRNKRKGRDVEDSECQSEDVEFESANANKAPQRSGSTRRSRAAEVHNLSERRRRDRINEKMRALQELIPHCNKSDKASMLDEAIEYLKSLQLQVQMMWMGSGMAPMMFPGVQHYMSRMGMGMRAHPSSLHSMHSPMQLPRVPLVNQSISSAPLSNQSPMCPPLLNGVNFQNPDFSQAYSPHMGFHHMQNPQAMNAYGYSSQIPRQNSKVGPQSTVATPSHGLAPTSTNTTSNKLG